MEKNIYLAGVGGQGIQVAGKTMAQAAFLKGYRTTYSPRYEAAKRGGLTSCYVTVSEDEIGNPRKELQDILVVMEPKAYERFSDDVKHNGILLVNSSLIHNTHGPSEGIRRIDAPLYDICVKYGNTKIISSVVLGVLAAVMTDIFPDPDTILAVMLDKLKGKESLAKLNKNAYADGLQMGRELLGSGQ